MWPVMELDSVDSTNDECKRRAMAGEEGPLAVMAHGQTGGRGRRGRSFQSLADKGLYLSVLFRPQAPPDQVSQLTAWTAVAVCKAIEGLCSAKPSIKWPNDVLVEGKKLCGILTELVKGRVVIGMGVNLTQTAADFGPDLADKAISLAMLGADVGRDHLAHALLAELEAMAAAFPGDKAGYLADYRRRCVTLGREAVLLRGDGESRVTALDIDDSFALRVRLADGTEESVSSGEVSVRGLLGYS